MAFFLGATRVISAILILSVGACSSVEETELYGYEESFVLPEPDMIPVMPDDKPGRTVDEMLDLKPGTVTVKKATYETVAKTEQTYERTGRFGSKEKISLRKGLNAPETGVVFSPQKRKEAAEVRPLKLKKQEKDELLAMSEEEVLAQIIAPKAAQVEMIEVVPAAAPVPKESDPKHLLLPREQPKQTQTVVLPLVPVHKKVSEPDARSKVVLSAPKSFRKKQLPLLKTETVVEEDQEKIVLLRPPVRLKNPDAEREETVLSDFSVLQEKLELRPLHQEERIILKRPGSK